MVDYGRYSPQMDPGPLNGGLPQGQGLPDGLAGQGLKDAGPMGFEDRHPGESDKGQEEETSSANYAASSGPARRLNGVDMGTKSTSSPPQGQNGAGSADELRELASKGFCAPLHRNSATVTPGSSEQLVHLLQTGWVRYTGDEQARRTSCWELSQSAGALHSPCPNSRSSSLSGTQMQGAENLLRNALASMCTATVEPMDMHRSLSGLSNMNGRMPLSGRSTSLMGDNMRGMSSMGMPLEQRSNTMAGAPGLNSANFLNSMMPMQRNGSMYNGWPNGYAPETPEMDERIHAAQAANNLLSSVLNGNPAGSALQAILQGAPPEGMRMPGPSALMQELERNKAATAKFNGWGNEAMLSRQFRQEMSMYSHTTPMQDQYGMGMNEMCGIEGSQHSSMDHREAPPIPPHTPYHHSGFPGAPSSASGLSDSMSLQDSVRAGSLQDAFMDPLSGRLLTQLPEKVMMALVTTPSMFAVPTCINKGFNPPFSVRVAVISAVPTQIKATVAAYVVQKDQVSNLERWHPAQHVVTESLSGAVVTQTIVCNGSHHPKLPAPAPGKHQGVGEFKFTDLKFHSSSRMKPRWLLFALTLPTDDVIFCQYTVPTIVMSRQCDQHSKALLILRGDLPTKKARGKVDSSSDLHPAGDDDNDAVWPSSGPYTAQRWRDIVEKKCQRFYIIRAFDPSDLKMLMKVAGFEGGKQEVSQEQWTQFGNWFMSYLRLFRCHQQLWLHDKPRAICGFGVDRTEAERLLHGKPNGAFLVRPSMSLAGTMVISAVTDGRIKHMALDGNQLDSRSLEVWVRDVCEATHVLDVANDKLIEKERVFVPNYRRVGVAMDLVVSPGQMFSSHHPHPRLPSMPSHRGSVGSPFSGANGGSMFGQGMVAGALPICSPVTTGIPGQMSLPRSPQSTNMSDGN